MAKKQATVSASDEIQQIKARWLTAKHAEEKNREEINLDKQFRNLQQWPDDVKGQRNVPGRERPMLTIDQLSEPIRQVCNRQKESKPAIQVNPVSDGANTDGAEVRQGLIRRIEVDSHASFARSWAFEDAVTGGLGYYRVCTEYENNDSGMQGPEAFDQVIKIESIENNLSVYCDPGAKAPDRRDARYYFIVKDLPKDEYKRLYPNSQLAGLEDFRALGDDYDPEWLPEGRVRVAEYYYKETKEEKILLTQSGKVVPSALVKALKDELKLDPIVRERTVQVDTIKWCLINAIEELEQAEWPGKWIPIIPVFGERLNVNGMRIYRGIIRAARDSQRMYNYHNSALVEDLALAPKSKVIMAEGQEEGHEDQWDEANVRNLSYLLYKATTIEGQPVPPPTVAQFTDPAKIQSLVVAINQAKADLRSTTGWYDATDPNRKNADQSGKAILARKESQAQGSTNYLDNLHWALIFEAEILLDLLPKVYDRAGRVVEILTGESENRKQVILNQPFQQPAQDGEPPQPMPDANIDHVEQGIATLYDMAAGKYGVTVSIGASYTTRRQEAVDWQLRLIESNPQFFGPAMADIAVRNMDGPGHVEIADRLERAVPPQLKGKDQQGKPEQQVQMLSQQMQQAQQMIEALTQQLHAAQDTIEQKKVEAQAEVQQQQQQIDADAMKQQRDLAAKVQIAQKDNDTKLYLAQLERDTELQIASLRADVDREKTEVSRKAAMHKDNGSERTN